MPLADSELKFIIVPPPLRAIRAATTERDDERRRQVGLDDAPKLFFRMGLHARALHPDDRLAPDHADRIDQEVDRIRSRHLIERRIDRLCTSKIRRDSTNRR